MSEFSFPFTGGSGGDSGPYSAEFYTEMTKALFYQQPTVRNNAGVILGTGNGTDDPLEVTETSPASNQIEIKEGKALVQGYYYFNDSDLALTVQANIDGSGFDRIDTVVLEVDFINQTVRADIVVGTPSAIPVPPTLTKTSSLYQVPLADIQVANLFTTILNADIDNTVKLQHAVWQTQQGGTGIEGGVQAGYLIAGSGVETMDLTNAPDDYGLLIGNALLSTKMNFVGDIRPHQIRGDAGGAVGSTRTITPFTSANWVNPSGFITALSSNQFSLESGIYIVWGFNQLDATAQTQVGWWIADSTAPTIAVVRGQTATIINQPTQILTMYPQLLTSTGSELFEVYTESSGAGSSFRTDFTGLEMGSGGYSRVINFMKIR